MTARKSISLFLSSILVFQAFAPLAYSQVQGGGGAGGGGGEVITLPGTDPGDTIVPDTYSDLPTEHSGLLNTSYDPPLSDMWTTATTNFLGSIDYSQPPQDPDTFNPSGWWDNGSMILGRPVRGTVPSELTGGSVSDGSTLITPPIDPGTGGGSGGSGGSGGTIGGRGEVSGFTNTNTGFLDFTVPIVSFTGPGNGAVNLALQMKSFTPTWATKLWTDNYDIRLDASTQQGMAVISMPSGLKMPFTKVNSVWVPPMGIRAELVNVNGLGYQLKWRNGDIWWFGGQGQQGPQSYVTYISYRKGGNVTIQRSQYSTTVSTGSRTATINFNPAQMPSGIQAQITAPNGVTSLSSTPGIYLYEYALKVMYPAYNKTIKLFYKNVTQNFIVPGGGMQGQAGTKFVAYQDAKQVAVNSSLRYDYTYDTYGRVTQIKDPNSKTVLYAYVTDGQTKITNEDGKISWDYYTNGRYIGGKDQANFSTVIGRNSEHDVTSYRNERNQTWTIGRNASGDAMSVTNPLNKTTYCTYNNYGDPLTKTTALGFTTTYTYGDPRGNLSVIENSLGQTVLTIVYDTNGQPVSMKDALLRTSTMGYNSDGDLTSITGPEGLTSTATYNNLGAPIDVTDPANRTTQIIYDSLYRVFKVIDPAGTYTQYTYDLNDNITQVRDGLNRISTMTYDVLDNLSTYQNPRGDTETYTYTPLSELKTVINGRGKTRYYQYTVRGEMKYIYMPDGTSEYYGFYGDGSVSMFNGTGRSTINYSYDNVGRLSVIDYPSMTDTTFSYDYDGRRTHMVDSTGTTVWTYDAAGRVTSLNQAGQVTSYTYNLLGDRSTMTQAAGTTTYTYDSYGRPNGLTNPYNEVTTYTYDSLSRISTKELSSGTKEFYAYDSLDRLDTLQVKKANGTVLRSEGYTYNVVSEVLSHTVDGVTTNYGYDAASQLTSESRPGYSATYTFDGNGNRLTKTLNGVTEHYTYDNGDKLLTAGSKSYEYDLAGRTKKVTNLFAVTNLTYDDEDRLLTVTGPGISQSYTYNGADTRISKTHNGSLTSYQRDGAGVTAPLISDTGAVYTPGVSEKRGGVSTFFHGGMKDLGAQSDTSQSLTATRQYDAYGMVVASTGTWKGPFGFSGQAGYQEEETGLQLLGHRYYDASTGRFLTRDPLKDGRNWYTYCSNNPTGSIDANGLKSATAMAIGAGIHRLGQQITAAALQLILRSRFAQQMLAALGLTVQQAREIVRNAQNLQRLTVEVVDEVEQAAPSFLYRVAGAAEQAATAQNGGRPVPSPGYDFGKPFWTSAQDAQRYMGMAQRSPSTLNDPTYRIIQFPNPLGVGYWQDGSSKWGLDNMPTWWVPNELLPKIDPGKLLKFRPSPGNRYGIH